MERLKPLKELSHLKHKTSLRQVGLFSYYFQRILKFSNKIKPLVMTEKIPLNQEVEKAFNIFKKEIEKVL